jgi:hypothetical protein
MNSSVIGIALLSSIMAGALQAVMHQIAERRRWKRIPRYATGLTIINVAYAPVVFLALPVETAATLYGLLWLIGGASGLATWLAYDADTPKPPLADYDLDRLADMIAGEHRESQ